MSKVISAHFLLSSSTTSFLGSFIRRRNIALLPETKYVYIHKYLHTSFIQQVSYSIVRYDKIAKVKWWTFQLRVLRPLAAEAPPLLSRKLPSRALPSTPMPKGEDF